MTTKLLVATVVTCTAGFVMAVAVMGAAAFGPGGSSNAEVTASCSAACGELTGAVPAGPADRFGLPVGYTIPDGTDPAEFTAVQYALAQLGKTYVWGAAGPDAFDCSGLTMMAWAAADVPLPHYSVDQMTDGSPVTDLALIAPGDLVLVPGSDGTLAAPGHVGLYIGEGLVESAVDPAQGVIVQSWTSFIAGGLSAVRHIG